MRRLLDEVRTGTTTADDAVRALRDLPYADLGFARVDHHRQLRHGMAEAVYGPGKTPEQAAAIVGELLARSATAPVLLTRASDAQLTAAIERNPGGAVEGRIAFWRPAAPRAERVVVTAAGTSDLPVADECATTLTALGLPPARLTDVGVAGVHRLLDHRRVLIDADAVGVVAGMEGALASLVGGLTGAPVVAVPTSVGYGASFEGVTALLAMLASCASGLTVVGIDNGFGAAFAVGRLVLNPARASAAGATTADEAAARRAALAAAPREVGGGRR